MTKKKDKEKKPKKIKEKKPKKIKEKKEKREIKFDLSDGVQWQDFAGFFLLIFNFFWRLFKIVLWPVFWIYGENVRMYRFIRASSKEDTLEEMQREFFETVPVIFTMTGVVGGILVGLFGIFNFKQILLDFFDSLIDLEFIQVLSAIWGVIVAIVTFIVDILVAVVTSIANFFLWIAGIIGEAFAFDPFIAFSLLALIGFLTVGLWLLLSEKGVFAKIFGWFGKIIGYVIEYPEDIRFRISSAYRKMNHKFTAKLVGAERISTRTQVYFRKSMGYTMLLSLWSFFSGIYVGLDPNRLGKYDEPWQQVLFTALVIFTAGFISGTLFLAFVTRFLDLLNRRKYIAPEFIVDDNIDEKAVKEHTKEIYDQKPWLKGKPVHPEKDEKIEEKTDTE